MSKFSISESDILANTVADLVESKIYFDALVELIIEKQLITKMELETRYQEIFNEKRAIYGSQILEISKSEIEKKLEERNQSIR